MNAFNHAIESVLKSLRTTTLISNRSSTASVEAVESRTFLSASPASFANSASLSASSMNVVAVLDTTQNFGTTKRAVNFYDVSDLTSTGVFGQQPLFSVWTGFEDAATANFEDPDTITVDPATGDVYMSAFDSGTPGTVDTSANDTNGDFDLYKIDFQAALNDFITNNRARGTMYAPVTGPDGRAAGDHPDHIGATINLAGVSTKLGELSRAQSTEFFDYDIEYAGDGRIVMLDNQTGPNSSGDTPANDHQIRLWERVSTSAGAASYDAVGNEGGFNRGTSESWESAIGALVNMDYDATTGQPVGRSEPVDISYVNQDGTEGVWVGESDGGGDNVAFFEIDWNNQWAVKKQLNFGTGPYFDTFALDDTPNDNQGSLDFIIADSGEGIRIGESGFFETPNTEPKTISLEIGDYNFPDSDASGGSEVLAGSFSTSGNLVIPSSSDDDTAVTDGRFVTFDPVNNQVYYFDLDSGSQPNVVSDVYVYDLDTNSLVYSELNAANHFLERHGIRFFTVNLPTPAVAAAKPTFSSQPIAVATNDFAFENDEDQSVAALVDSL